MNIYIQSTKRILRDVLDGRLQFEEHLDLMIDRISGILDVSDEIIICGMTPVGRNCLKWINTNYGDKKLRIADLRDQDGLEFLWPEIGEKECSNTIKANKCAMPEKRGDISRVYIICSREEAVTYLNRIPRGSNKIITYNEMMILDDDCGIPGSLLHTKEYVLAGMRSIFGLADKYLRAFDYIEEEFSCEVLAKFILYRLYADVRLMNNISSRGKSYFDPEVVQLTDHEVFVDAGGYDGDTLSDFLEVTAGEYSEYHFFEPSDRVFDIARDQFGNDARITFYNMGLSSSKGVLFFDEDCDDVPEMIQKESGNVKIEVAPLDEFNLSPTYIKMDIEGAECDAFDGARETIKKYKPRLAICVYHKPDDFIDILDKMLEMGYNAFNVRAEKGSLDFDVVLYGR